jgi:outer membrane protein OmpA-like peptidoglycan-associated protein
MKLRIIRGIGLLVVASSSALATQVAPPMVFFEPGRSDLTPEAKLVLSKLDFTNVPDAIIYVVGNTDRAGSRLHNLALSCRRAETVRQFLSNRGLAQLAFVTLGNGEDRLLIDTKDGVAEPQNRNVQIVAIPVTTTNSHSPSNCPQD